MNLSFPSKTDALLLANRLVHPDAVLRKLRILAVLGVIREHRGVWKVLPKPVDEPDPEPIVKQPRLAKRADGRCACPGCKNPTRLDATFCSRKCVYNAIRTIPEKPCKVCGTATRNAKYCSMACKLKALSKPLPKCRLCDNTVKKHGNIYCSHECHSVSQKDKPLSIGKRRMVNRRKP
jgi:predicted nucleic acid-binding Zn ribbon protein